MQQRTFETKITKQAQLLSSHFAFTPTEMSGTEASFLEDNMLPSRHASDQYVEPETCPNSKKKNRKCKWQDCCLSPSSLSSSDTDDEAAPPAKWQCRTQNPWALTVAAMDPNASAPNPSQLPGVPCAPQWERAPTLIPLPAQQPEHNQHTSTQPRNAPWLLEGTDLFIFKHQHNVKLYDCISQKLCDKIWNQKYIDLGQLLVNPLLETGDKPKESIIGGVKFTVSSESQKQAKKISSFYVWIQAFHIYMAILLQFFPNKALELLQYAHIIQNSVQLEDQMLLESQTCMTKTWTPTYPRLPGQNLT